MLLESEGFRVVEAGSGEVSPWATDAMAWAVDVGLIHGRGNNDLVPRAEITRAEVAVLLNRFTKLFWTGATPAAAEK